MRGLRREGAYGERAAARGSGRTGHVDRGDRVDAVQVEDRLVGERARPAELDRVVHADRARLLAVIHHRVARVVVVAAAAAERRGGVGVGESEVMGGWRRRRRRRRRRRG
eukprot:6731827-Prymnesium_polylepis.1